MYQHNPQMIGELKAPITAKNSEISKEESVRVIDNFARRLQVCLRRRGGRWGHIWGRTWLLCKETLMTETSVNDCKHTEV